MPSGSISDDILSNSSRLGGIHTPGFPKVVSSHFLRKYTNNKIYPPPLTNFNICLFLGISLSLSTT